MPELPEVNTTSQMLNSLIKGFVIEDVWSDYNSPYFSGKNNIKDKKYFSKFKKNILGEKIKGVERKGKNILIHLQNNKTILVHMKMTGHLLFGKYEKRGKTWETLEKGPLKDPFNRFIHFVIKFSNKKCMVLSDMRKFAKVTLLETDKIYNPKELNIGPDPTHKTFNLKDFKKILKKMENGKIKEVLMKQEFISGIGNIYSDEALWYSGIDPERRVKNLKNEEFNKLLLNIKKVLKRGIELGGDSMSDYRNPLGEKGKFQLEHKVYGKRGERCSKKGCDGKIERKIVSGRSAHFCNKHQT